jgi:hypothetical protein
MKTTLLTIITAAMLAVSAFDTVTAQIADDGTPAYQELPTGKDGYAELPDTAERREHNYAINTSLLADAVELESEVMPNKAEFYQPPIPYPMPHPANVPATYVLVRVYWGRSLQFIGYIWLDADMVNYLHGYGEDDQLVNL